MLDFGLPDRHSLALIASSPLCYNIHIFRHFLRYSLTFICQGRWSVEKKHYFNQKAKVNSCAFHIATNLLVVGFSNGCASVGEITRISL